MPAFGLHRDVVALLHFNHQRAGETYTRGSQGPGCRTSRKVTAWLGAGWSGRCRQGEEGELGPSAPIVPKKCSPDGHFPTLGLTRARQKGMGLPLQRVGLLTCWPAIQKVNGSIPSQGPCLGCGPGTWWGACARQPHIAVSLPLFLPSPLSKYK